MRVTILAISIFGLLLLSSPGWNSSLQEAQAAPLSQATLEPAVQPTVTPTTELITEITSEPGQDPTTEPTSEATDEPTSEPTPAGTVESPPATLEPTVESTVEPIPPTLEPTEEATVEATATPEPTQTLGDIINKITAEGRPGDNQTGHQLLAASSSGELFTALTAADGSLVLSGLPAGSYNLTAKSPGFLAVRCEGVAHTGPLTPLNEAVLLAGDLDGSGEIDSTDATAMGLVFGLAGPGEVADLNLDGRVDILDFVLLAANFGQTSAHSWLCQ